MIIEYNLKNIENLCNDFFNATGINLSILDSSNKVLFFNRGYSNKYCELIQSTAKGKNICFKSDENLILKCKETKTPQYHLCKAGLMDIAVPITLDDEIIGYIILGQIKVDDHFDNVDLNIKELSVDLLKKEYLSLPKYSESKIHSTLSIASILAKHLLVENIIKVKRNKSLENVLKYIEDNLNENLSIEDITKQTYISKTSLYLLFKKNFNMTVSEYINSQRIKRAIKLLKTTDLDIENISLEVGFSSQSYFSKIFKKINGISPIQYRKDLKE